MPHLRNVLEATQRGGRERWSSPVESSPEGGDDHGINHETEAGSHKEIALDYRRASKKKRGERLDWLVALTGYNRSYAARVLRQRAKPKVLGKLRGGGIEVTLIEDERTKRRKRTRSRPRKYGKEVIVALREIWVICDCICGKRLASYLPEIIRLQDRLSELTRLKREASMEEQEIEALEYIFI